MIRKMQIIIIQSQSHFCSFVHRNLHTHTHKCKHTLFRFKRHTSKKPLDIYLESTDKTPIKTLIECVSSHKNSD